MFALAFRQLRWDLGRSALTCVGIAEVFAVILLLQGFRQGLDTQLRRVALARGADLIATQAGVLQDLETGVTFGSVETSRRFSSSWTARVTGRLFRADSEEGPLYWFRHDDYLEATLEYHY